MGIFGDDKRVSLSIRILIVLIFIVMVTVAFLILIYFPGIKPIEPTQNIEPHMHP